MTFKIARTTLSADVATNGTFTVSYPAGTQAGSYAGAFNHKMWANGHQKTYTAPADFTLSFGASSITVTYKGTTTLPANSKVDLQLDRLGDDAREAGKALIKETISRASVALVDLGSPVTAVSTAVAASQSVSAGASFTLNGTLVTSGIAIFDVPRNVVAAWTTTSILTITGTDADGNTVVEKSASGASHTGKKAFKTVTSVSSSASITGATVGNGNVIGLPRYLSDSSFVQAELMDGVALPKKAGRIAIPWEIEQTELLAPTAEDLVAPCAGYLASMTSTIQAAITTGGTLAVAVNAGTATVGLTQTIANSATKGTRQTTTPTTRHGADTVVAKGDRITITPASFATAGQVSGILEFDATSAGQLDGTLIAGDTTAVTATTGDTRGTYAPAITPDGTHGYILVVTLPDPSSQGVAQYTG